MDALIAAEGFEDALREEVAAVGLRATTAAPGVVVVDDAWPEGLDPVFARQRLPGCARAAGDSVARLAKATFDLLALPLDSCDHWSLHAFAWPGPDPADPSKGRPALVAGALLDLVHRHRRRARRRFVPLDDLTPEQAADLSLAQVLLLDRGAALVSLARPARLPVGLDPDPRWPAGVVAVAPDRRAPSSAYRKAEEAYARLGLAPRPGERVVDLGGSPGGWTWTALARGARVLAVDRAPLAPPAGGHPLLEERRGDAFRFEPDAPVDWLLCDVIAAPERTLDLLDRWLAGAWCRRFVVNVKFKGTARQAPLDALRALLARRGARARVKHLVHDKNEVTAFGLA
ncbi:MAG: hypothetical protein M9894_08050 [Planctomycetes bacterium]|nr:hypothetical protein [Planctomycetota bacterium]